MLGKLIKHDFISGARRMGTIYLIAGISVIALTVFSYFKESYVLKYLSLSAIVLISFAAVIVTFVSVVFGMNKSLFGRQGYLSQTLPVKTTSLIFSKWLTSSIWLTISYILVLVAAFFVGSYAWSNGEDSYGIINMAKEMIENMGFSTHAFFIKLAFECLKGLVTTWILVLYILFAMTVGNIRPFDKAGMFGIIIYTVLFLGISYGLSSALNSICNITFVIPYDGSLDVMLNPTFEALDSAFPSGYYTSEFTGLYFRILLSALIYILTSQLTERKINLK